MLLVGWGHDARQRIQRATMREPSWTRDGLSVFGDVDHAAIAAGGDVWAVGRTSAAGNVATALSSAIDERGLDQALRDVRGAWVAVVWFRGQALVAHDQLGARPLVYTAVPGGAVVAEDLAALLPVLPAVPEPDPVSVAGWLNHRQVPSGRSLLSRIGRVPAGQCVLIGVRGPALREQWRPTYAPGPRLTPDEAASRLRDAVLAAVARASASATRPALSLSGGLDSGAVAAGLRAAVAPAKPLAFAGVFPDEPVADERALIEATARAADAQLILVPYESRSLLPDLLASLRRWRQPPISLTRSLWTQFNTQMRSRGVDVVLDGEGGDELFGCSEFLVADEIRAGRLISAWRLIEDFPGYPGKSALRTRRKVLTQFGIRGALPLEVHRRRRRHRPPVVPEGGLARAEDALALMEMADFWDFKRFDGPRWWAAHLHRVFDVIEGIDVSAELHRAATDAGFDGRHPFLHDVELLEAVLSSPPKLAFDARRDRALLRDAMAGDLAPEVHARTLKADFYPLLRRRFEGLDGQLMTEFLRERDAPVRGYVNAAPYDALVASAAGEPARDFQILTLVLLDAWLRLLHGRESEVERLEARAAGV